MSPGIKNFPSPPPPLKLKPCQDDPLTRVGFAKGKTKRGEQATQKRGTEPFVYEFLQKWDRVKKEGEGETFPNVHHCYQVVIRTVALISLWCRPQSVVTNGFAFQFQDEVRKCES